MKLTNIVVKPSITEKSAMLARDGKFTFVVNVGASKSAVANAVEKAYKVEVTSVKSNILPGKYKRTISQKHYAKTPKIKKAVVTLKKGQTISLFELGEKK